VEEWRRWIAGQRYVQNSAACLVSRVEENTDVPKVAAGRQNGSGRWQEPWQERRGFGRGSYEGLRMVVGDAVARDSGEVTPGEKVREVEAEAGPEAMDHGGLVTAGEGVKRTEEEHGAFAGAERDEKHGTVAGAKGSANVSGDESAGNKVKRVDFRLQALLGQRDERLKWVKRLEVVGDTLYVEFWSRREAEAGPGKGWLVDAKWLYPVVNRVNLI
jgi:hypothetical protein